MSDLISRSALLAEYDRQHEGEPGRARKLIEDAHSIVPKWLYRLESKSKENGLWYNSNGEMVWGIGKLPNCKTKDLPMDYDERYHKEPQRRPDALVQYTRCA